MRYVLSIGNPVMNESGDLVEFIGICMDITERRQADEALRASEKRYRLLFERNLAGVFRSTIGGRFLGCNQAAAHLLGYDSPDEVLAVPVADLYFDPADREVVLDRLKSEKTITDFEMRLPEQNR